MHACHTHMHASHALVVELLAVLAVVALGTSHAKQALLQDRVFAVPQCDREAQAAVTVADAQQPILAPAICTGRGMVKWERSPA